MCRLARLGISCGTLLLLSLIAIPSKAELVGILDSSRHAIEGRIHILESAEDSVDVLYFAIHDDLAARMGLAMLREKAMAGVRVRMIVNASGLEVEPALLYHLQSSGDLEIRLYHVPKLSRPLRFLRQLHDKLILIDGERYIAGGRNVGEIYFDLAESHNKKDRDIYVEGPSADTAQAYFEELWASSEVEVATHAPYSRNRLDPQYCERVRIAMGSGSARHCLRDQERRLSDVEEAVADIEAVAEKLKATKIYQRSLRDVRPELYEVEDGAVTFIHDPVEEPNWVVARTLGELVREANVSILVQSPYVVPTNALYPLLELKRDEGVPIRFLTNSMKSTVNVIAHAGYVKYRKKMLDAGAIFMESTGDHMLHAKSIVLRSEVDGEPHCIGGIGSFNVDPRSANLNTETYILVRDCTFADELEEVIMEYAVDSITLESREDLYKEKELKSQVPTSKKVLVGLWKIVTPLIRSQI